MVLMIGIGDPATTLYTMMEDSVGVEAGVYDNCGPRQFAIISNPLPA